MVGPGAGLLCSRFPVGRKIALISLALLLASGAGVAVLWQRATALPEWYEAGAGAAEDEESLGWEELPVRPEAAAEAGARPKPDAPARPRRTRRVLRNPHLRAVGRDPALRAAVRASRATYEDGHLEAGVVLDGRRLANAKLSPEARRLYRRAARAFPSLVGREIYIALEDEPRTRGGFLQLGRRTEIRVGDLRYSLEGLARKLGVSPRRVRADIDRMLRDLRVTAPGEPVVAKRDARAGVAPGREAG